MKTMDTITISKDMQKKVIADIKKTLESNKKFVIVLATSSKDKPLTMQILSNTTVEETIGMIESSKINYTLSQQAEEQLIKQSKDYNHLSFVR
jgi:predicted transcriptional regulator